MLDYLEEKIRDEVKRQADSRSDVHYGLVLLKSKIALDALADLIDTFDEARGRGLDIQFKAPPVTNENQNQGSSWMKSMWVQLDAFRQCAVAQSSAGSDRKQTKTTEEVALKNMLS